MQREMVVPLFLVGMVIILAVGAWYIQTRMLRRAKAPTNTSSAACATAQEKIAFLERYATCPTRPAAAEFTIRYATGGGKDAEWDIRFAVKVAPAELPPWTRGLRGASAEDVDLRWWSKVPMNDPAWTRASTPEYYVRPNDFVYVVVYREEGIILKALSSAPL